MQKPRSRSGGSTIMRRVPTLHCSGPHHQNSPVRQGKRPNRAILRSRKFLLQTGTNSGVGSHGPLQDECFVLRLGEPESHVADHYLSCYLCSLLISNFLKFSISSSLSEALANPATSI